MLIIHMWGQLKTERYTWINLQFFVCFKDEILGFGETTDHKMNIKMQT